MTTNSPSCLASVECGWVPFTTSEKLKMAGVKSVGPTRQRVKGTHPHSTLAKQLGEFVVIYSPLQMAADAMENYEGQPALTFIESCPTTWSKTIIPNGKIGEFVTVARKERDGDRWFVGSITNERAREIALPLDFLDAEGQYRAIIYEDGPGADYQTNPYPMTIRQEVVSHKTVLQLHLARSGGAAIRIEKVK